MTKRPMPVWRQTLLSYPCPTCGVQPGDSCLTPRGAVYYACHAPRASAALRCHKCAAKLPNGAMPVDLCPRCQLLRDLTTEAATTWRRQHP